MTTPDSNREARRLAWQEKFCDALQREVDLRGIVAEEPQSPSTLTRSQLARITTAGWDPESPGEECLRRLPRVNLGEEILDDAEFIEVELHAQEYAWRFGDGPEPLTTSAARKVAACVPWSCGRSRITERQAWRRWIKYCAWVWLRLYPAVSEDRQPGPLHGGEAKGSLARMTHWRTPPDALVQGLGAELRKRPHLFLEDAHIERALQPILGYFDTGQLPAEVLRLTPREFVAHLMELRVARKLDVPPMVLFASCGEARIDIPGAIHVLSEAYGAKVYRGPTDWSGWGSRPDPRARLRPELVLARLEMNEVIPDLDPRDAVMLTIQCMERTAERWTFAPLDGKDTEITQRQINRTVLFALDGMVRALRTPKEQWFATMRRLGREYARWFVEMLILHQRSSTNADGLNDRDLRRLDWFLHARNKLGPTRDWSQFATAVTRALARLGQEVPPQGVKAMLGLYKERARGPRPGLFATDGGRICLGERQVRDLLTRSIGIPRIDRKGAIWEKDPGAPPPKENEVLDQQGTTRDQQARHRPEDPFDALLATEALDQVRQVINSRQAREQPGTTRHLVLEHFEELRDGQLSARELGRQAGRSHGKISKALAEVQRALAEELGVSEPR